VLGYNTVQGVVKGFIRVLFDFAGLALGVWGAWAGYTTLALFLKKSASIPSTLSGVLAFLLIWGLIFGVITFVGSLVQKGVQASVIGAMDYVGGFFIGLVKGGFVLFAVLIPLYLTQAPIYKESKLVSRLEPFYQELAKHFPTDPKNLEQATKATQEKVQKEVKTHVHSKAKQAVEAEEPYPYKNKSAKQGEPHAKRHYRAL